MPAQIMPLLLYLGLAAAILAGVHGLVYTLKESGRDECRAEHIEAARMAELRARERGLKASTDYEKRRGIATSRERAIAPQVASAVAGASGRCFSSDGVRIVNDDVREGRRAGDPEPTVPKPPGTDGK